MNIGEFNFNVVDFLECFSKDDIKKFVVDESRVATSLKDLVIRIKQEYNFSITQPTIGSYLENELGSEEYGLRKKLMAENRRKIRKTILDEKKNDIFIESNLNASFVPYIRKPIGKELDICGHRGVILNSDLAKKLKYKFEIGPIDIGVYDLASLPKISRSAKKFMCNKEYYDLYAEGLSLGEDIRAFQYLKKENRFVEQKCYSKLKLPTKCYVAYLGIPKENYRSTCLLYNGELVKRKVKFWRQKIHMFGYRQIDKGSFIDDSRGYTYKVREIVNDLDVDIVGEVVGTIKPSYVNILGQMRDHKMSGIEKSIDKWLRLNDIKHIREHRISFIDRRNTRVDFFIPPNICLYCDGDYWHSLSKTKKTDMRQNEELPKMGYKVIRLSGKDIKQGVRPIEILDLI